MDIFTTFKSALKIREVHIDNHVFQLHYRVTALLLLGCAALVASKQHFGDPIDCITRDDVPNKIMDTYCWIHATFTLSDACNLTVGTEVAHPCVDKSGQVRDDHRVYHKYYQWVYFVLFFQALCFYAPHLFWKSYESNLLKTLTGDLREPLFEEENEKRGLARRVARYVHNARRGQQHQNYFFYFTIFEVVNFVNVILQIYLVDEFLGGTFTTYGLDVLKYIQLEQEDRVDPMVRVFPRMTKCTFHRFGSSGDVQRHDALCILPLNIINEKIYVTMWFWFMFLAIVSGLWLVYRFFTYKRPDFRLWILSRKASLTPDESIRFVLANAPASHWFLISMICKNMDSQQFRFFINELYEGIVNQRKQKRFRRFKRYAEMPKSEQASDNPWQTSLSESSSNEQRQPLHKQLQSDTMIDMDKRAKQPRERRAA